MLGRVLATSTLVAAAWVVPVGTAVADTQPADLGNAPNADRGASAPGPHCHYVLPASGKGTFTTIISAAAHQAHSVTGLSSGVFAATGCPTT